MERASVEVAAPGRVPEDAELEVWTDPWERPLRCDQTCARSAARGVNSHACRGTRWRQRKQMKPRPFPEPPHGDFSDHL